MVRCSQALCASMAWYGTLLSATRVLRAVRYLPTAYDTNRSRRRVGSILSILLLGGGPSQRCWVLRMRRKVHFSEMTLRALGGRQCISLRTRYAVSGTDSAYGAALQATRE
eukprot:3938706-Rhodomonas_salina.4